VENETRSAPSESESESTEPGPLTVALEAQGSLQPGQEGWWKVWGASVRDVQPGDIVMLKYADDAPGQVHEYEVEAYAPRVSRIVDGRSNTPHDDMMARGHTGGGVSYDQLRPRFRAKSGELFSIGGLQPIVLVRKGTHNFLSDYVR
jgi:hypothetical protein